MIIIAIKFKKILIASCLTLFRMEGRGGGGWGGGGGGGAPPPPVVKRSSTSFSPTISTNAEISLQNFGTFSFKSFATLV